MKKLDPNAKLKTTVETRALYTLAYDAEQDKLYGAGEDWAVYGVELSAEKLVAKEQWTNHENYVSSLVLRNGEAISGGYDRRIIWTDLRTGKHLRTVDAHDGWVRDLSLFDNGERLISVGDDMQVKIWSASSGDLLARMDGHAKKTAEGFATALYAVAVSPDGSTIASGDRTGVVCLWNTADGQLVRRLQAPEFYTYDAVKRLRSIGGIRALRFSPDGKQLAIGGIGKVTNVDGFVGPCRVELWDWNAGKRQLVCHDKHKAVLNHIIFHPTRSLLIASGGGDGGGLLAFWSPSNAAPLHKAKPKGHLHAITLDIANQRLLAAGHGGFQIWDFPANK